MDRMPKSTISLQLRSVSTLSSRTFPHGKNNIYFDDFLSLTFILTIFRPFSYGNTTSFSCRTLPTSMRIKSSPQWSEFMTWTTTWRWSAVMISRKIGKKKNLKFLSFQFDEIFRRNWNWQFRHKFMKLCLHLSYKLKKHFSIWRKN